MSDPLWLSTEIEGTQFRLILCAQGKPYILRRRKLSSNGTRHIWSIVWASWHKGLPTGLRARAMKQFGFVWKNDSEENPGWHGCAA
jgi:hypothetical protein